MTDLIDLYHNMKVTVTSSDGRISATGDNQHHLRLAFRDDDAYLDYDADTLAHQLGVVLRRLESSRRNGNAMIRNQTPLRTDDPDKPHWDTNRRRYRIELRGVVALGQSPSGVVDVGAMNLLSEYEVFIDAEELSKIESEVFLSEFHAAYSNMVNNFRVKQQLVRQRHLPA